MGAPIGYPYDDQEEEADPEAQRAALDALMSPTPAPAIEPISPVAPRPVPGYGADDGAALARAQDESAHNKWDRDLSAGIYSTFSGTPRPKMEARDPAAEMLQRRTGVDQESALKDKQAARQAKLALEAEDRDPESEGNRMFRAAIKASNMAPDLVNSAQFARITKPRFEAVYGKDIAGKLMLVLAHQRAAAKSGKQPMDPNELAAARAQATKLHPEIDFSQMSFETMKPFLTAANARDTAGAQVSASDLASLREDRRHVRDVNDRQTDEKRREVESGTQDLEKRIPPEVAGLKYQLGELDRLTGGIDPSNTGSIPGVGRIAGRLPNVFVSKEGQDVRQFAKGVLATQLKMQSGSTVSENELERKMDELGLGPGASEHQFRTGLRNLKQLTAATLQQHLSGFRPEVQQTYRQRGGVTPEDVLGAGGGAQSSVVETRVLPDGRTIEMLSDGTKRVR